MPLTPTYPPPIMRPQITPIFQLVAGFQQYPTNFNLQRDCQILYAEVHGVGTD